MASQGSTFKPLLEYSVKELEELEEMLVFDHYGWMTRHLFHHREEDHIKRAFGLPLIWTRRTCVDLYDYLMSQHPSDTFLEGLTFSLTYSDILWALFRASLEDLPPFIGDPFRGTIVRWRFRLGR